MKVIYLLVNQSDRNRRRGLKLSHFRGTYLEETVDLWSSNINLFQFSDLFFVFQLFDDKFRSETLVQAKPESGDGSLLFFFSVFLYGRISLDHS